MVRGGRGMLKSKERQKVKPGAFGHPQAPCSRPLLKNPDAPSFPHHSLCTVDIRG